MKLVSRLRGLENRDGQQQPPPPPSTLPGGRRLSVAAAPPRAASSAGIIAARDRSRSLCVERLGLATLLHPAAIPVRELNRRRASSALSSSNDLISRRGVFSRRHYGSVELLPQLDASGQDPGGRRFRIENGDSLGEKEEIFGSPCTPVLENPEFQTRWYFKYFLGKLHQNYVGSDVDKFPFFLSVVLTDANHQCVPQYRAILWRKTGAQKILLPHTPHKPMTVKQILRFFLSDENVCHVVINYSLVTIVL
ncbi:unnamed protein product [Macrosiphum euphorbiae]|uniref:GTPase-activating Rap/Ran-GAP domain-like protein 3 n=1 Tax=Macrosiphum euphorbiae TaxID=13131 RepID=A0AAV0X8N2_9HEMI|nr:unnamed protein product [Macrosiphum euphorbiae]